MSEPNIVTTQGVVDALAAWVSSTLAGHTYPAPDGTYKEVRVFTHNLPEPEGDDDADLAFCPFCIVHAGSGTVEDWGRQTMPIVLPVLWQQRRNCVCYRIWNDRLKQSCYRSQ